MEVTLTSGAAGFLDSITLTWKSDRDTFLTETNSISLPELGIIQLAYGGLDFPASPETISVDNGDTLTLNMGNYDLELMWYDSATDAAAMGQDNNLLVLTEGTYDHEAVGFSNNGTAGYLLGGGNVWWNTSISLNDTDYNFATNAINVSEDQRFLVTAIDPDLTDIETLYYEVSSIDIDDASTWTVELDDLVGNKDLTFTDDVGDTEDVGDVTVTLTGFSAANDSVFLTFSPSGGQTMYYDTAVSEKGLVITLPESTTSATNGTGATLTFREADRDDDINEGLVKWTATIKNTTNEKFHVSTHNLTAYDEEESDDHYIGYVPSDLATKFEFDTSADEYDYAIYYYGDEVTADVEVIAGGEVTSEAVGGVLVKDTEVSSVSSKNLIVVGGSCINSVAANLVGGAYCGSSWTSATNVGSGQFLIQSFGDAYTSGKVALLVAGYDVSDTVNAATYLRTQTVDTTAGKKYIGTTSTQATLQVA